MADLRPFFGGQAAAFAQPDHVQVCAFAHEEVANDTALPDQWRIPVEAGWNVFPLVRGTKVPVGKWNRFQRERASPQEIARWSAMDSNTAIVTGEISRLVVLDLDDEAAFAEAQRRGLPSTVEAKSPRGRHFYFAYPGFPVRNRIGSLFEGADLKGDGGYVVAPGSVFVPSSVDAVKGKCAGKYVWLRSPEQVELAPCPDWLLEAMRQPEKPSRASGKIAADAYAAAALVAELEEVRSAPEGSRNQKLNKAAFSLGQLYQRLDETTVRAQLMQAGLQAGLTQEEVRGTVESGWNDGRASPRPIDPQVLDDPDTGFRPLRLSPLENARPAAPVFPVEVFGRKWGKWIATEATGASAPADYVALGLLVGAASLIGNSRRASARDRWIEACVLWGCIVGDPSAGKTPALRPVFDLLRPFDQAYLDKHALALVEHQRLVAEADAAMQKWKKEKRVSKGDGPPLPKQALAPAAPNCSALRIDDVTPEKLGSIAEASPRGLLMARDEIAGWLGDMDRYTGSGERALWLTAWNGDFHRIDRQKAQLPIVIPHFSVSVLGGIQPDKFDAAFASSVDDGLISRFLFTWPEPVPRAVPPARLPWGGQWPKAAVMRLAALPFGQDEHGKDVPRIITLGADAQAVFNPWWIAQQNEKVEGLAKSAWGKMPGQALRIALVLEFLWWSASEGETEPAEISVAALQAAISLVDDYFKPMALRVFGEAAIPVDVAAATLLARFIVRKRIDCFNARELQRGSGALSGRSAALKDHATLMKACEALVDAGWLLEDRSREGDTKGRERRDFLVNPVLWAALREQN